ncbi:organic hydroperoxide resistance protein [Azospirillum agricola]|uniref:organic hydroperoxide resistance protein n=1 Tax=Azospirillum agricola TaxID=1720247 RepID=UPI000A0EF15C|nr:organic hydroperoxide resistance protein [Azospirillum agricola]MBP2229946.1 Ohr subfamily peroxiredoxin [Azospirillum agricola]SMH56220.1 peroxiredoxin, Ohr subfamily [Azospirillum lipoferum]
MTTLYTANARTSGGREGHVQTDDGLLSLDLAMPKSLGGKGNATNPEQLFAAGYAACFESAVRHVARLKKLPLADASVASTVNLLQTPEGGFALSVALAVTVKGLEQAAAEELVATAHTVCPYSNAVRGNIDVALSVQAA